MNVKRLRFVLTIAILACVAIIVFYNFSRKSNREKTDVDVTSELSQTINKDLERDYPKTPKAVVEYYNKVLTCLYNYDYSDKQFEELSNKEYALLDEDLKKNNPKEVFVSVLQGEVKTYKDTKTTMVSYNIDDARDVEEHKYNGDDYSTLKCSYFVKRDDKGFSKTYQTFILRKDKEGLWKIYGFKTTPSDER